MNETLRKFVVATSEDISNAESSGGTCVQLIYRISDGGTLQRAQTYAPQRRGIMGIYDNGGLSSSDPDRLFRDIYSELTRKNYSGVLLDFQQNVGDFGKVEKICSLLSQKRILHFIPLEMAMLSPDAKLIVQSAISGGSLNSMLSQFVSNYDPKRLCLEVVRSRNDFAMPSYQSEGSFLSLQEFEDIIQRHNPSPFFSQELGCKYFTYRTEKETHFVLFDDADTASYKIKMAESMGFYGAFLLYSEWKDMTKSIMITK